MIIRIILCTFIILFLFKKNKYLLFVGFILLSISYGHLYFYVFTKNTLDVAVFNSILETNYQEASSVLTDYYGVILISLLTSFISFYLVLKIKLENRIVKKIVTLLFIYLIISCSLSLYHSLKGYRTLENIKESTLILGEIMYKKFPPPLSDISYLFIYFLNDDKYSTLDKDKIINNSIIGFDGIKTKTIIFIMGESSWKKRYSIYGYNLDTTPKMKKIFTGNLNSCVLSAYSGATITRDSIPLSFSFSKPENYTGLTKEKSIIELAKIQGYKTYWLSSQDISGLFASKYGYLTKSADVVEFTHKNDNKIPILLNQALQDRNEKKLIILHLRGSHAPYSNFTKEDKQSLVNLDNYDLTIHQTDRVIGNIFKTLNENKIKFSLIYTSDHGEVINKGHGFSRGRSQIEIPLLAYSNNGFDLCSDYKKYNNKNGDIGPLINKIVLLNMIGIKLEPSFIRNEMNNENMIKANGDIINYRDFK